MGNRHTSDSYSFQHDYDILDTITHKYKLYKLRSRSNHEVYIGKQLNCNDQYQAYQLQCILHQKINNPSPFVTKLLKYEAHIQDTYCSTDHKFYLLYQQVGRLLAGQINQRIAINKSFTIEQVENVINRVAKGIKYVYDINHHHGAVSSRSIAWPSNLKQSIQLIDEWALPRQHSLQIKQKIYRPKDDEDINQKQIQRANDLFSLGIVARQMLNVGAIRNNIVNHPGYNQLINKIDILTSHHFKDRLVIYNILSYSIRESVVGSKVHDKQGLYETGNITINRNNNIGFNQGQKQIQSYPIKQVLHKQSIHLDRSAVPQPIKIQSHNKNSANNTQVFYNKSTTNATGFSKKSEVHVANTRNTSLSTSKANIIFNSKNTRNQSVNKIQQPTHATHSNIAKHSTNYNLLVPSQATIKLPASISKTTFTSDTSSTHISQPIIQFNNKRQFQNNYPAQPVGSQSSLINFKQNSIGRVNSQINLHTPNLYNFPSSSEINYSFMQNSDKRLQNKVKSLEIQNLFTSPDFFNKISQSPETKNNQTNQYLFNPNKQFSPPTSASLITHKLNFIQPSIPINNEDKLLSQHQYLNNLEQKQLLTNPGKISIVKKLSDQNLKQQRDDKVENYQHDYQYQQSNVVIHQSHRDDQDQVKQTPGKNNKSNQPFSTIPEVSERSASVRSDDERDFVIEEYENGSRYQGFKSNGMRNGKGKFFYQQGSFYDGEWRNNNMHGYGNLYYSNNKIAYQGQWFTDQFHGKGKVYNDEPVQLQGFFDYTNFDLLQQRWKYYQGDLVCDSKQGQGKLVLSNDQYYEGQFRNDKVDGKGKFVNKKGQVINGIWQNSKLFIKL